MNAFQPRATPVAVESRLSQPAGWVHQAAGDPVGVMIQKVDDLAAHQIAAIFGQSVRVDPGMARQKRKMSRRLEAKRDRLVRYRHGRLSSRLCAETVARRIELAPLSARRRDLNDEKPGIKGAFPMTSPENGCPIQLAQSPERTQVATIARFEVQSIGSPVDIVTNGCEAGDGSWPKCLTGIAKKG